GYIVSATVPKCVPFLFSLAIAWCYFSRLFLKRQRVWMKLSTLLLWVLVSNLPLSSYSRQTDSSGDKTVIVKNTAIFYSYIGYGRKQPIK
ncbi:MAG: hypothetical protein J7L78_04620, partial [Dehalococcoidales bacterium]|nr:hypothetical protein [Dehalococcoidales bacterium]